MVSQPVALANAEISESCELPTLFSLKPDLANYTYCIWLTLFENLS